MASAQWFNCKYYIPIMFLKRQCIYIITIFFQLKPAPKSSRGIERDVPGDIPGVLPGEIPGNIPHYITVKP